ncbi:NlpC/P60 family protein [Clostridium sp. CF012]|uniref:C40 family peptidase n=1 Tax=Clostridium sp. CF012 TaxID=2843319 RepID=UPI001C0AE5C9|nr:C40 family peptidase [Clostridium sp. CF012]MBU3142646.1 C40 family peptidase [Clostridium sp. CF012]
MKHVFKNMAIVTTLFFTLNITALAAETNAKLQPQKDLLTKIQTESQAIERKIEEFDNEIEKNMAKTEENKIKILQTEKAIKSAAEEISMVENKAKKEQELFDSRMRTMYINGFEGYTSILLNSESFGDFISRVENIRIIIKFDEKIMNEFEAIQDKLNETQICLNNTKVELLDLQLDNNLKLEKIILAKESQKKLINQLNIKENLLIDGTSKSQVLSNKSTTKPSEMQKSVAKIMPSRGATNLSKDSIIDYASNFLGTPYLWAGTSPSTGFDCSGFTQYVYGHFGISVGRSTSDQINDGIRVAKNNLQPGDLVFFGSGNNPQHTGIYAGNNNYIHSPRSGDVVRVSPMTRTDYITARRVR